MSLLLSRPILTLIFLGAFIVSLLMGIRAQKYFAAHPELYTARAKAIVRAMWATLAVCALTFLVLGCVMKCSEAMFVGLLGGFGSDIFCQLNISSNIILKQNHLSLLFGVLATFTFVSVCRSVAQPHREFAIVVLVVCLTGIVVSFSFFEPMPRVKSVGPSISGATG